MGHLADILQKPGELEAFERRLLAEWRATLVEDCAAFGSTDEDRHRINQIDQKLKDPAHD